MSADELRRIAAHVSSHAPALHALDTRRIAAAIADAARRLADPISELGAEARALLPATSGLSTEMVGWALHAVPRELDLPCHRVVNRYGELSGGWHFGHPDIMKGLLVAEGVLAVPVER